MNAVKTYVLSIAKNSDVFVHKDYRWPHFINIH